MKIEEDLKDCHSSESIKEIAQEKKQYYKKRMYSSKQIQELEKEVEEVVERHTTEMRNSFGII